MKLRYKVVKLIKVCLRVNYNNYYNYYNNYYILITLIIGNYLNHPPRSLNENLRSVIKESHLRFFYVPRKDDTFGL